jgi:adenylate cyclase
MDETWRELLEGTDPSLIRYRRMFGRIPSSPRCKICNAPFGRPGNLLLGPFGWRRWAANPTLCRICVRGLDKEVGGAEIEATFLFADIRGSTGLAERLRPAEFHALLERFYRVVAKAVDVSGGLVDKYMGDGVVGLFVPIFAHEGGAAVSAIRAGQGILSGTGHLDPGGPWLPIGVGVHSGPAYVGVMGTEGGALDFTGVGDTVNTAARLGSVAGTGELLVSIASADRASLDGSGLERRVLELKGRQEAVEVFVLTALPTPAGGEVPA